MFNPLSLFKKKATPEKLTLSCVIDKHLAVLTQSIKIKNSVFVISLTVGLIFMFYRFVLTEQEQLARSDEHIALIELKGAIDHSNTLGSGLEVSSSIKQAIENPKAKAIVIRANSGGGAPVQAEMIYTQIKTAIEERNNRETKLGPSIDDNSPAFVEHNNKEIYVVMEDVCASACYLATVAADHIIAHPSSLVGSIGVRIDTWQVKDALERFGVKRVTITSGENKAILDPFVNLKNSQLEEIETDVISPLYQLFVDKVLDSRAGKISDNHTQLFSGMIFTGERAKELGLIDAVSTLPQVIEQIKQEQHIERIVAYNKPKFSVQSLLESSFDRAITSLLSEHSSLN